MSPAWADGFLTTAPQGKSQSPTVLILGSNYKLFGTHFAADLVEKAALF